MREEIRKLFPLEFYINDKGEMVSEISLKTLNKLSDEIIKLEEENERLKIEKQEEYNRFNLMAKFRDRALERTLIYKSRNEKAIEYIENDMPYLEEPDDDYENTHKMIEYDKSILLNILNGGDKE